MSTDRKFVDLFAEVTEESKYRSLKDISTNIRYFMEEHVEKDIEEKAFHKRLVEHFFNYLKFYSSDMYKEDIKRVLQNIDICIDTLRKVGKE